MVTKNVVVLCAEWCGVCREFKEPFEALGRANLEWNFAWVDIESHPDTEEVELETLPTLMLVGVDDEVVFLGPVVPKTGAIEQLLRGVENNNPIALSETTAQWVHAVIGSVRKIQK